LTATTTEPEPSASTTVEPETPSSTALPESEPSSVESPASSTVEPTPSATDAPETPSVPPVCTTPGVGSCPTPAGNFAPVGWSVPSFSSPLQVLSKLTSLDPSSCRSSYGSDSVLFDLAVASTGTQLGQLIDLVTCMAFCSSSSFSAFVPAAVSDKSCFCVRSTSLASYSASCRHPQLTFSPAYTCFPFSHSSLPTPFPPRPLPRLAVSRPGRGTHRPSPFSTRKERRTKVARPQHLLPDSVDSLGLEPLVDNSSPCSSTPSARSRTNSHAKSARSAPASRFVSSVQSSSGKS
jgi:hypothetical protein